MGLIPHPYAQAASGLLQIENKRKEWEKLEHQEKQVNH
jgi:hypothetical protein